MKIDKQKIAIIALSVALFLISQYIILEKWIESNQQKMNEVYQRGYDTGSQDAVIAIYEQTQNCQTTTVTLGNLTKNIFDLSCIQTNLEKSPNP